MKIRYPLSEHRFNNATAWHWWALRRAVAARWGRIAIAVYEWLWRDQ